MKRSPVRMRLYSGHDNTVGPLLKLLNTDPASGEVARQKEFPRFGCHITLELYEKKRGEGVPFSSTENLWLRVLYNGEQIRIPNSHCNKDGMILVHYDSFRKQLAPLIPSLEEYVEECAL